MSPSTLDYILYFGTTAMLLLSIFVISIIVISQSQFNKQRKYFEARDKMYIARIEQVETLVKNEFINLIKNLKT